MESKELEEWVKIGEKELARLDQVQLDKKNQQEIEQKLKIRLFLDAVHKIVPSFLHEYVQFGGFERQDTLTRYNATAKIVIAGFAPIVLLCYYNDYKGGDLTLRGIDLLSYQIGKDLDADYGSMFYVNEYATHVLLPIPSDPAYLDVTFFAAVLAMAKQKGDNKAEVEQEVEKSNQEDKDRFVAKIDDNTSLVYRTLPGAPDIIARLVDTMQEFVKWVTTKDDGQ